MEIIKFNVFVLTFQLNMGQNHLKMMAQSFGSKEFKLYGCQVAFDIDYHCIHNTRAKML